MVSSRRITLGSVIEERYLFNVPIYQRLYVWGEEQIRVLLEDLNEACHEQRPVFYLGGVLVIERPQRGLSRRFDLIDGQQRFTTLWLISIACEKLAAEGACDTNHLSDYRVQKVNGSSLPRISFPIRPNVERFFEHVLAGELPAVAEAVSLKNAIDTIEGFLRDKMVDIEQFTCYLRDKVELVLTEVPAETDLNKLFEIINNRGVQLQHHEILKARLLEKLPADERTAYGQLWDASAHMSDYAERNLRQVTELKVAKLYDQDKAHSDGEKLARARLVISALNRAARSDEMETLSLDTILTGDVEVEEVHGRRVEDEQGALRVRSIITFPMLLQHVLRIHLMRTEQEDLSRILDKDLLLIFQQSWLRHKPDADEVRDFLMLLWEVRYRFDKHIIKWVEEEDEEIHAIRRPRLNRGESGPSLVRAPTTTSKEQGFALLQSMLYHSQQLTTQYWLTPLLNFLLEEGPQHAFIYLKHLDNHLLCADEEDGGSLAERTWRFMEDPWFRSGELDVTEVLNETQGTSFAHYWFYKLEFILWDQLKDKNSKAWREFRMTAKNSVEHVSPQQRKSFDSSRVSAEWLDAFGNLALVSRSINSEYSNKPYAEKRARFVEKSRERVDSLKMTLIYKNKLWNDELVEAHQNEMIGRFAQYFRAVDRGVARIT
ncbi:DUF262 domain-containing HNH endonuclease family protein [Halomonas sp. Bachu 37]|uniref:DUF262 domain-containing protein n=1 Tax=Halomonas kashgarensis TaxID=3084920 RepID=UPI00321727A4